MQAINAHIYNECNKKKTAQSNQNPNLESARRDSLREDGPAQVNFSISPAESPAVASREKPAGKEEQQSRHRALFIPKEGKETLRVNLGKNMVSRPKSMGSGVGYAKGRY